jgi:hypothetical protein
MKGKNLDSLITEALAIEDESAKEAGALGFMARALVQATMPHSKRLGTEFIRQNGLFTLTMLSPSKIGLPYGSMPRLLLAWVTTEAVLTKNKHLILGSSLSDFMNKLDIMPTGGRWGSITYLKDQIQRLFSAAISCTYDDGKSWTIKNIQPVSNAHLWWDPKQPHQTSFFESTITLGEDFFNEIINNPIPIDMRALQCLRRSPMAIDIYCWLTYRMSYLKANTCIPWGALEVQFGSEYKRTRSFKENFIKNLRSVQIIYPNIKLEDSERGLVLKPSLTHVSSKNC